MIVYSVSFPETLALESSLAKRYGCIQERALSQTKCTQSQTKQNDWPEETQTN